MPEHKTGLENICRHCGAVDPRRLGLCSACGLSVCDKCGDIQHVRGEKNVIHNACLKEDGGGFTMIKFVR